LCALHDEVVFVHDQFEHKTADASIRESHKVVGKSVLAFSDCVVVSVSLRSDLTALQGTCVVLMSEFTSFALAQGACVLRGIFLRGGVDLGFWFRRKGTLISPAMVNAYRLERDACIPMIAVTPDLRKYLANHANRCFYNSDFDPIPKTLAGRSSMT
jgi:hypothetical protein